MRGCLKAIIIVICQNIRLPFGIHTQIISKLYCKMYCHTVKLICENKDIENILGNLQKNIIYYIYTDV